MQAARRLARLAAAPVTLSTANFSEEGDEHDSDFEPSSESSQEDVSGQQKPAKKRKSFDVEAVFNALKAREAREAVSRPPPRKLDPKMRRILGVARYSHTKQVATLAKQGKSASSSKPTLAKLGK